MKRLLLILAFYVPASVGVRAQVVSGEEDSTRVLWEFKTEYSSSIFRAPMYFSSDKSSLLSLCWYDGALYEKKNHLQKRDIYTGDVVHEVEMKYPQEPSHMIMSNDMKYLLVAKGRKHVVTVYDSETFEFIKEIKIPSEQNGDDGNFPYYFIDNVYKIALSPDNKTLAIIVYDGDEGMFWSTIVLMDFQTGELIGEPPNIYRETNYSVIGFTPNNKYFYYGQGGGIDLLNTSNYEFETSIEAELETDPLKVINTIWNIDFTTDNKMMITFAGEKNKIEFYDLETLTMTEEIALISNDNNVVRAADISDNNQYIFYSISDGNPETKPLPIVYDRINKVSYKLFLHGYNTPVSGYLYNSEKQILICYHSGMIVTVYINFDELTSVKENNETNSLIYPNPASETINIPVNEYTERIEIYDVRGELVKSTSVPINRDTSAGGGQVRINISRLPVGTYFVKVYQGGSVVVHQFIKG
jgi:WD40 repeat protein